VSRIRVIGIGAPWGDDQLGWRAAEALRMRYAPHRVEVLTIDRPGPALIEYLSGAECVLLLDAVWSGSPAGQLHCLDAAALVALARPQALSHALGVAEAVALAASLGTLPRELYLLGVELEQATAGAPLSAAVTAALPTLVEAAQTKIAEWLKDISGPGPETIH